MVYVLEQACGLRCAKNLITSNLLTGGNIMAGLFHHGEWTWTVFYNFNYIDIQEL